MEDGKIIPRTRTEYHRDHDPISVHQIASYIFDKIHWNGPFNPSSLSCLSCPSAPSLLTTCSFPIPSVLSFLVRSHTVLFPPHTISIFNSTYAHTALSVFSLRSAGYSTLFPTNCLCCKSYTLAHPLPPPPLSSLHLESLPEPSPPSKSPLKSLCSSPTQVSFLFLFKVFLGGRSIN